MTASNSKLEGMTEEQAEVNRREVANIGLGLDPSLRPPALGTTQSMYVLDTKKENNGELCVLSHCSPRLSETRPISPTVAERIKDRYFLFVLAPIGHDADAKSDGQPTVGGIKKTG